MNKAAHKVFRIVEIYQLAKVSTGIASNSVEHHKKFPSPSFDDQACPVGSYSMAGSKKQSQSFILHTLIILYEAFAH
jgi:hypothetical protein